MGQGRLLVVDDEEVVRRSLRQVLEQDGYQIDEAADASTALELMQLQRFDVVISDNMMPGLSGVDFLKLARVRQPHVVRIMLTADPNPEVPVRSINESEVYRFIRKPWDKRDLRTIVHFAFEVARLQEENRRLIELGRMQRDVRNKLTRDADLADIEAELLLLAEAEADLLE